MRGSALDGGGDAVGGGQLDLESGYTDVVSDKRRANGRN